MSALSEVYCSLCFPWPLVFRIADFQKTEENKLDQWRRQAKVFLDWMDKMDGQFGQFETIKSKDDIDELDKQAQVLKVKQQHA